MALQLTINGNNFSDFDGFYDEVERNLTKGLSWKIGRNLNAYNDVLRGGFGVHEYFEPFTLTWINSAKSEIDFGRQATIAYLEKILTTCHPENIAAVQEDLEHAKAGTYPTIFEDIVQITKSHEHINFVLA